MIDRRPQEATATRVAPSDASCSRQRRPSNDSEQSSECGSYTRRRRSFERTASFVARVAEEDRRAEEEEKEARAQELVLRVLAKFKNAPPTQTPAELSQAELARITRSQRRATQDLRSATIWQTRVAPELAAALEMEGDRQERPYPLTPHSYLIETVDKAAMRWKLLPFGTFRTCFDLYTLALVLYTALTLPVILLVLPADVPIRATHDAQLV